MDASTTNPDAKMHATIAELVKFFSSYCHFRDKRIALPIALWTAATFVHEEFDAFPYGVITARTKRAGKTRLAELISFTCRMPFMVAGATAPTLFRKVTEDKPTIIWDEAETLTSGSADAMRSFLNVGYKKGQTIPRSSGKRGIIEYDTYCPKIFILIGDVFDTLRDRSIIFEMQRGTPEEMESLQRYSYMEVKALGSTIAEQLRELMESKKEEIQSAYYSERLAFLTDRDEEIWRPLFAMCKVFCPSYYVQLEEIAADMSADKTNPDRYAESPEEDAKRVISEYGILLLRDCYYVVRTNEKKMAAENPGSEYKSIPSQDLLSSLKAIPTSPWRRFYSPAEKRSATVSAEQGSGLTVVQMCYMLKQFGIAPKPIRNGDNVFRGYTVKSIKEAALRFVSSRKEEK